MKLGIIYKSCSELPLHNFIKVMVTENLNYLLKHGYANKKQLRQTWDSITQEYIEISGDKSQLAILTVVKEVTVLQNKVIIIQAIVDHLSKFYNKELTDMLRTYGFMYKYDPNDAEAYFADLKRTVSASKPLVARLREKQQALQQMRGPDKKVTESEYDTYLAELSHFQGYHIKAKEHTVSQFIAIVNNYKKDIEIKTQHGRQNR